MVCCVQMNVMWWGVKAWVGGVIVGWWCFVLVVCVCVGDCRCKCDMCGVWVWGMWVVWVVGCVCVGGGGVWGCVWVGVRVCVIWVFALQSVWRWVYFCLLVCCAYKLFIYQVLIFFWCNLFLFVAFNVNWLQFSFFNCYGFLNKPFMKKKMNEWTYTVSFVIPFASLIVYPILTWRCNNAMNFQLTDTIWSLQIDMFLTLVCFCHKACMKTYVMESQQVQTYAI